MTVKVDEGKCIGCAGCVAICLAAALRLDGATPACDASKCINCQSCVRFCPAGALALEEK